MDDGVVARSLIDLVADSLSLADSVARPGCESARAKHDEWLEWLAGAFPEAGLWAKDIGSIPTIKGGQTSCSFVLGAALYNFGVPTSFLGSSPTSLIPHGHRLGGKQGQPYVREITPATLPRKGDPYFLFNSVPAHCHHAIFGGPPNTACLVSRAPFKIHDYSGGQASKDTYERTKDAGRYQRTMTEKAEKIFLGGTGTVAGAGEELVRPILWFTDMWAFFRDHAGEVKAPRKKGL